MRLGSGRHLALKVLVMNVPCSENQVVRRRKDGKVALRQGDKSVWLDYEQIRSLEYDKGECFFESEVLLDALDALGLTDRELRVLGIVESRGRISPSDLVEELGVSRRTASDTLKRLTAKNV